MAPRFAAEVALAPIEADGEIVLAHLVSNVSRDRERLRQEEVFAPGYIASR